MGFLAFGLGKQLTPKYSLGVMYGVVPRDIADGPSVETVTIRQTYRVYDWNRLKLYLGGNIYHVLGVRYQASKYGDVPRNYYPVGSLRAILYGGFSIYTDKKRQTAFYVESGMNDIWITNWVSNDRTVDPLEHVSLALGWKAEF